MGNVVFRAIQHEKRTEELELLERKKYCFLIKLENDAPNQYNWMWLTDAPINQTSMLPDPH